MIILRQRDLRTHLSLFPLVSLIARCDFSRINISNSIYVCYFVYSLLAVKRIAPHSDNKVDLTVTSVCAIALNEEQEQFLRELVGPVGKFFEVISNLLELLDEFV